MTSVGAEPRPSKTTNLSIRAWALGALTIAALLGLVWLLIKGLTSLQSGVAAAVVTASATVLISVFSLIYSHRREQRRAIEHANREQKIPVYEEFIRVWFSGTFDAGSLTPDDWTDFVKTFTPKLVFWASDAVLRSYNDFRRAAMDIDVDQPQSDPTALFAFEDLLFAIRRDLGHSNDGLERGDLLRLYINDVDDHLVLPNPSSAPN